MATRTTKFFLWLYIFELGKYVVAEDGIPSQAQNSSIQNKLDNATSNLDYTRAWTFMNELANEYPNFVELATAQKLFDVNFRANWYFCDGEPCEIPILRVCNRAVVTSTTPEIFFSGAVHGDEVLGVSLVLDAARYLCRNYSKMAQIAYLMNNVVTYIIPFANAHGYAHGSREENHLDPNRDFPYGQQKKCMQTFTARAINELFRRHLFVSGITFHAGYTTNLSYEWGATKYVNNHSSVKTPSGFAALESPDFASASTIGGRLQKVAGVTKKGDNTDWYYPILGNIIETIYPVIGGLSDWSYAGSWDGQISATCLDPNADYPAGRIKYDDNMLRNTPFVVETQANKIPYTNEYGDLSNVLNPSPDEGVVPRNMRVMLELASLSKPALLFENLPRRTYSKKSKEQLTIYGIGCNEISSLKIIVARGLCPIESITVHKAMSPRGISDDAEPQGLNSAITQLSFYNKDEYWNDDVRVVSKKVVDIASSQMCQGLGVWEQTTPEEKLKNTIDVEVDIPEKSGNYCLGFVASFDQSWAKQTDPNPNVKPQAHLARLRLQDYVVTSSEGTSAIIGHKEWVFPRTFNLLGASIPKMGAPVTVIGRPFSVGTSKRSSRAIFRTTREEMRMKSNDIRDCPFYQTFFVWFIEVQDSPLRLAPFSENLLDPSGDQGRTRVVIQEIEPADSSCAMKDGRKYSLSIRNAPRVTTFSKSAKLVTTFSKTLLSFDVTYGENNVSRLQHNKAKAQELDKESPHNSIFTENDVKVTFQTEKVVNESIEEIAGKLLVLEIVTDGDFPEMVARGIASSNQLSNVFDTPTPGRGTDMPKPTRDQSKPHQLLCLLQDIDLPSPATMSITSGPNNGHILFTFLDNSSTVQENSTTKWGRVNLSGRMCGVDTETPLSTVVVKDTVSVGQVKTDIWTLISFQSPIHLISPGTQVIVQSDSSTYTCELMELLDYIKPGSLNELLCDYATLPVPKFWRSFSMSQSLILAIILAAAIFLVLFPCYLLHPCSKRVEYKPIKKSFDETSVP